MPALRMHRLAVESRRHKHPPASLAALRLAAAFAVVLLLPRGASADFHLMKITELVVGSGGDCRIQFVEMQMTAAGQHRVGNHDLFFFDAAGNRVGTYRIPQDVTESDNGSYILLGTQAFADVSPVAPDFILPEAVLLPHGGRVSFDVESPASAVDSLAYGIYSAANGPHGAPAAAPDPHGGLGLSRNADTGDNASDFVLRAPSPTNNAGATGALPAPSPTVHLADDFADMSRWDRPTPNAGLDLEPCVGKPFAADIGTVDVEGGALVFKPGLSDNLDLDVPIAFTGLTTEAAREIGDLTSYRTRFDFVAGEGSIVAAVFARQHYLFDDAAKLLDISQGGGMGLNFSFDSITEVSDHAHPDVRLACLRATDPIGPRNVDFSPDLIPGGLLVTQRPYTLILDSEGDDVQGPLVLSVKLFDAEIDEPSEYFASWTLPTGLGVPPDEDIDHGILIAALGVSGSRFEVTNLRITDIPRGARAVRNLTCVRQIDGSIRLDWENPIDGDVDAPIAVIVNSVEIERLDGDETSYEIFDAPEEDIVIEVVNFSCTPAVCELCFNDPADVVIDGPATATLPEVGSVSIDLDSNATTDAETSAEGLVRLWSIASSPVGAAASLTSTTAVTTRLMADTAGEYRVRLDVTDLGCVGDSVDSQIASAEHTVVVSASQPVEQFRRGDTNASGGFPDLSDGVYVLNFLFLGGPAPTCPDAADANDSGGIDLSDASFIFNFLFIGGPATPDPGPSDCGADATDDDTLEPCVYEGC